VSAPLTHSPADVLSRILIDLNLGTDPAAGGEWPVYVGDEPAPAPGGVPDELITVSDTTGVNDGRSMPTGERFERHGVQVKLRARRHDTGWERMDRICHAINEDILRRDVTIDGHAYLVQTVGGVRRVHEFKKDAKSELRYFSINGLMAVRKTSA
jgi:hypothetical protein